MRWKYVRHIKSMFGVINISVNCIYIYIQMQLKFTNLYSIQNNIQKQ